MWFYPRDSTLAMEVSLALVFVTWPYLTLMCIVSVSSLNPVDSLIHLINMKNTGKNGDLGS